MNKRDRNELLRFLGINRRESECLTSEEVVLAINNLRKKAQMIIEANLETGISEYIRKSIMTIISEESFKIKDGTILNKCISLSDAKLVTDEFVCKFIEDLDKNYLHMIVEPNGNLYIDVNYTKLKKDFKCICTSIAIPIFIYSEKIQETAIVSKEGVLTEQYFNLRKQMLIDTDFEKDEAVFKYCNELINYLDLIRIYIERGV